MAWLAAILSAVFSFILEIPIDKAITDWAKASVNGSPLFIAVINIISFVAIFSGFFAVFSKIFGGHGSD